MLRFASNDTRLLTLSDGETLTVKARLTHGEVQAMYSRMYALHDGQAVITPYTGDALIVAYLVDWTAKDDQGRPVPIRGLSPADVQDRLDALEHEAVLEIRAAIKEHEQAMRDESAALKKTAAPGAPSSVPTLQSVG
jgi:hypothetical protein